MPNESGTTFSYLTCPLCGGRGSDRGALCKRCNGRGVTLWLEGTFFYWAKKIDFLRIFQGELQRTANIIFHAALIFFGILGILSLILTILQSTGRADALGVLAERTPLMGLFALSLFTDLYAYYRFQRESMMEKLVKAKSFETIRTDESDEELFGRLETGGQKTTDIALTFTREAHKAIEQAWQLAKKLDHGSTQPIHLLGMLMASQDIRTVLARLGIDIRTLTDKISRSLQKGSSVEHVDADLSDSFRRTLLGAYKESFYTKQPKVDVAQLLSAIIEHDELSRNIFYDLEIELDDVRNVVEWLNIQRRFSTRWRRWQARARSKPKGVMNRAMTAIATPLLDQFSRDLTNLARAGALPPSVGREREIEETFRILEAGKNVMLVGNPGVGKMSIVEGIAELMTSEEVPLFLQDKRFISLSVASLVGASGRQGELEGRLIDIINEITRSGNIVVFIDGIEKMIGISTEMAQNLDIADIFAQALQRRLFVCIATTTPADFRRYVEQSSLMDVFTKMGVDEPETNQAIRILEGKAGFIEAKSQVYFSYDAIERTVRLSQRYIHDRYLPEKAINLLEEVAVRVRKQRGKNAIIRGEDVADLVSRKTNIPLTRVTEKESGKLLKLEERIHDRVVDQEEAVVAVATALRRARAELRDIRRPIVNLLFLGPTGVGKTELAKTVAEVYFGSENTMIRLDMSEYQEKSSINRLIGAPPGYTGAGEGGYLTEAVRTHPFSLLLLDEIEKAHPDILNVFLQVMDDGRLTDTLGRTIDFTNVILIGTSNAGTPLITQRVRESVPIEEIKKELIEEALGQYFRPEFLNRFDNIIVFKPLGMNEVIKIVGLLLKQVQAALGAKGVAFEATPEAIEELARVGFDPVFGARPLRRAIQERVDNALANFLLQGKIGRRDVAVLESDGRITVRRAQEI